MKRIAQLPAKDAALLLASTTISSFSAAVVALVQNAVDANAHAVDVGVQWQGRRLRVSDDGSGVASHDIVSMGMLNATSEKHSGDRPGLTLASLAVLSALLQIDSRCADAASSSSISWSNGIRQELTSCKRSSSGTTVTVEGLFDALPVRQRTESENSEIGAATAGVLRLSLLHPDVAITIRKVCTSASLRSNDISSGGAPSEILLRLEATRSVRARFASAFGADRAAALRPVDKTVSACEMVNDMATYQAAHQAVTRQMRTKVTAVDVSEVNTPRQCRVAGFVAPDGGHNGLQFIYVNGMQLEAPRELTAYVSRAVRMAAGFDESAQARLQRRRGSDGERRTAGGSAAAAVPVPLYLIDITVADVDIIPKGEGDHTTVVTFREAELVRSAIDAAMRAAFSPTQSVASSHWLHSTHHATSFSTKSDDRIKHPHHDDVSCPADDASREGVIPLVVAVKQGNLPTEPISSTSSANRLIPFQCAEFAHSPRQSITGYALWNAADAASGWGSEGLPWEAFDIADEGHLHRPRYAANGAEYGKPTAFLQWQALSCAGYADVSHFGLRDVNDAHTSCREAYAPLRDNNILDSTNDYFDISDDLLFPEQVSKDQPLTAQKNVSVNPISAIDVAVDLSSAHAALLEAMESNKAGQRLPGVYTLARLERQPLQLPLKHTIINDQSRPSRGITSRIAERVTSRYFPVTKEATSLGSPSRPSMFNAHDLDYVTGSGAAAAYASFSDKAVAAPPPLVPRIGATAALTSMSKASMRGPSRGNSLLCAYSAHTDAVFAAATTLAATFASNSTSASPSRCAVESQQNGDSAVSPQSHQPELAPTTPTLLEASESNRNVAANGRGLPAHITAFGGATVSRNVLRRAILIGQLDRKFLVLLVHNQVRENDALRCIDLNRQLFIVDQHAADERVRLEGLVSAAFSCAQQQQHTRHAGTQTQMSIEGYPVKYIASADGMQLSTEPQDIANDADGKIFERDGFEHATDIPQHLTAVAKSPPLKFMVSGVERHVMRDYRDVLRTWGWTLKLPEDEQAPSGSPAVLRCDAGKREPNTSEFHDALHMAAATRSVASTMHSNSFTSMFSPTNVQVLSVPVFFGIVLSLGDLREFIADLYGNAPMQHSATTSVSQYYHDGCRPAAVYRILASKSCRGAVMFGDELNRSQAQHLLSALSECRFPFQCAHGRPSIVPLTVLQYV